MVIIQDPLPHLYHPQVEEDHNLLHPHQVEEWVAIQHGHAHHLLQDIIIPQDKINLGIFSKIIEPLIVVNIPHYLNVHVHSSKLYTYSK